MLAAKPSTGREGNIIVYTYQHQGNKLKVFRLPENFDHGSEDAVMAMAITGTGETVFVSSPRQLWSFQTMGPREGKRIKMYPVVSMLATSELQAISYHPSSRDLVFGRVTEGQIFKLNPMNAWHRSFHDQQIQVSKGDSLLDRVNSIAVSYTHLTLPTIYSV
eukprot:TRINITY_DN22535_c0_g1_i1.p1 TRINITY_DN22535_c0_g1~~TRINITY_DN22535_c0_g1_i1.p1  ORF type:complete len:162 (-),score=46.56 TRINITY_DN22535_c0_g1_i1:116-601(-)